MKPQRDALGDEAQNASFSHPTWMHARRQPRDHDLYYPYIVNGQRVFMATCWCPRSTAPVDVFVEAMETAASAQRRLHA